MTVYRRDVKPGDCFRYAKSQNGKSSSTKHLVIDDGEGRPKDMPSNWVHALVRLGDHDATIVMIPHYRDEEKIAEKVAQDKKREDLLSNYSTNMHTSDNVLVPRGAGLIKMTAEEKVMASNEWSAQLRLRIKAGKEKERNKIGVDWDGHWD